MTQFRKTGRNKITRLAKRGHYEKDVIYQILDEGLFCTVAFALSGQAFQIPTGYVRINDNLYIHGSVGSQYMRKLAEGKLRASISVTHIDGLVLARSALHHSVNYRSVVFFSQPKLVSSNEKKMIILAAFTNKMVPGRWDDTRLPDNQDLRKTMVLEFPVREASAKIRKGPPGDDPEDYSTDYWAGVVPVQLERLPPVADDRLKSGIPLPAYLQDLPG